MSAKTETGKMDNIKGDLPLLLPASLEIEWLRHEVSSLCQGRWATSGHFQGILYIVHLLLRKAVCSSRFSSEYHALNAEALRLQVGKSASEYLYILAHFGIIEPYKKCKYQIGVQSRRFRLTARYRRFRPPQSLAVHAPQIVKRIAKWKSEERKVHGSETIEVFKRRAAGISFDADLLGHTRNRIARTKVGANRWKVWEACGFLDLERDGWSVSPKCGRLFSPLTNLPKDLRSALRIDGEPIAIVDLHASLPAMLARRIGSRPDKDRYLSNIRSGSFYSDICSRAGFEHVSKAAFKKQVMREIFFTKGRRRGRLWTAFRQLYPEHAQAILSLGYKRPSEFACLLQQDETTMMLGIVSDAIAEAFPGMPFATIHDGLVVPYSKREQIKEIATNAASGWLGFEPLFKITTPSTDLRCGSDCVEDRKRFAVVGMEFDGLICA